MTSEQYLQKIQQLKAWIKESNRIVAFSGAGCGTESGIPDFRSVDGLYSQKYDYPPETMLSHTFLMRHPEDFFRFYRDKLLYPDARPNRCHTRLAELESEGKLRAVITQNIDGLHQAAGSREVLELHGSVHRNYCMKCGKRYSMQDILETTGIPHCTCGGTIRPDVVLYEESLNTEILQRSIAYIREAEVLIVGGTSLSVYPAAGLLDYYRGDRLVLINKSSTGYDSVANLVINDSIGKVFSQI